MKNKFELKENRWLDSDREVDYRSVYEFKTHLKEASIPNFTFKEEEELWSGTSIRVKEAQKVDENVYVVFYGGYMFKELFNYYSNLTPTRINGEGSHILFKINLNTTDLECLVATSGKVEGRTSRSIFLKDLTVEWKKNKVVDILNTDRFFVKYNSLVPKDSETIGYYFFKTEEDLEALELTQEHIDVLSGKLFRREDWNWEGTSPNIKTN